MKENQLPLDPVLAKSIKQAILAGGDRENDLSDAFRAVEYGYEIAQELSSIESRHLRELMSYQIYADIRAYSLSSEEDALERLKAVGKVDRVDTPNCQLQRIIKNHGRLIKSTSIRVGRQLRAQKRVGSSRELVRAFHRKQAIKERDQIRKTRELLMMRSRDFTHPVFPSEGIPPEFYVNSMKILPRESIET